METIELLKPFLLDIAQIEILKFGMELKVMDGTGPLPLP
jgi:hypothetical protein